MKKTKLYFEGISKNLRYVFTNKGIYDFVEDKSMRYESLSFADGLRILKEVQNFEYKAGKITLQEHLSNPRRALIAISEIFSIKETVSLVNEWEMKYGSKLLLINESSNDLLVEERIEESWKGVDILLEGVLGDIWDGATSAVNWVGDKLYQGGKYVVDKVKQGANWVYEKGAQAWKWIKEKALAAWNCLTGDFVECLMEGLRAAMTSVLGIAVETFLAVTGLLSPVPMVLWGLMLIWDVYKMFSGKYESGDYEWCWFDIIIDVVGVATAGVGASVLSAVRGTFRGSKTISSVFAKGAKMGGAVGKTLRGIGNTIKTAGSTIMGGLKRAADWIAKNLGIKWFSNYVGKSKGVVDDIGNAATGKTVKAATQKTGEKSLSTWGKVKKGYGQSFDKTVGQIGKNKQVGKTTWGTALSKTAQTAVPVAGAMYLFGINPLTGVPFASQEEADAAKMSQQNTQSLEKDVNSLTTGTADYEAAGLI